MSRAVLVVVVFVAGASVLAIEILGTRLLGPFYGVSLFLWSALISVTLAALAAGYAIGGRWADRGPRGRHLAVLLAGAGLWTLAAPWLRHPVLDATEALGLRTAVLVASVVLFFPPLFLLGMVSPYAVRLRAERIEEVGRVAGDLYAISTVASVAAAVATGFWLIPSIGVTRLCAVIATALLVTAALAWWSDRRASGGALLGLGLLLPAVGAGWLAARPVARPAGVAMIAQSPYGELRVLDQDGIRYLLIDGGVHTAVEIGTGRSRHSYVIVADLARELFDGPGRMLLVGLGGGAAAQSWSWAGWSVDAVEIDPEVTRVARQHFGLRDHEAAVHHVDGRRFLADADRAWDVVFLDAFGSSAIPFHLITREAFELVRSRIAPGGVLVMNVEAVGWDHPLVKSLGATLRSVFREVRVLPIAEPPDALGNLVLIAADRPLEIDDERLGDPIRVLADPYQHWRVLERNHAWANRFEPAPDGGLVLTDDLNPVDTWAEEINRIARRALHDTFEGHRSW